MDDVYNNIKEKFISERAEKAPYGDFQIQGGKMLFQRIGPMNAQIQKNNKRAPVGRGIWAFPWPIFEHFFVSSKFSSPNTKAPKKEYDEDGNPILIPLEKDDAIKLKKTMMGLQRYVDKKIAQTKYNDPESKLPLDTKWEIEDRVEDIEYIKKGLETGQIPRHVLWKYVSRKNVPEVKMRKFWWGGEIYARFAPKGSQVDENGWYKYNNPYDYVEELRKNLIQKQKDKFYGPEEKLMTFKVDKIKGERGDMSLSSDHLEVFIPM